VLGEAGTEAAHLIPQRIANDIEREERPAVKCGIVGICLEISGGWRPIEFWKFNALPAVREAESNHPRRKAFAVRLQHFEQERSQAATAGVQTRSSSFPILRTKLKRYTAP
jgi:hypothetical protein